MLNVDKNLVAEICLYGAPSCGFGFIATVKGSPVRSFGNGEPVKTRCMSEALWRACADLRAAGAIGLTRVYSPGCDFMADVDTRKHVPSIGDLTFRPVPVPEPDFDLHPEFDRLHLAGE